MFDLTLDEEKIVDHIIEDISTVYPKIVICQICHPKLWKDESVRGQKKGNTSYSLCCGYGKDELPSLKEASSSYRNLYRLVNSKSKHFMKNIRRYNSMLSFTSMGDKVDSSINRGNTPYIFKLNGQNYHSIRSLLPTHGSRPKFCQLYIYDTENEISNRSTTFGGPTSDSTLTSTSYDLQIIEFLKVMLDSNNALVKSYRMVRDTLHENSCANLKLRLIGKRKQDGRTYNLPTSSEVAALTSYDLQIIEFLKVMLDSNNALVKSYRMVRDTLHENSCANLKLRLIGKRKQDGRTYNLPTSSEVAALVVGDFCDSIEKRDIVFQTSSGLLQRISELYPSYLAFQYPLLFAYGDDGYRVDILHRGITSSSNSKRPTCTMREFFAYRIQDMDQSTYISNVGQRVILPSSFTGGAHYMMQNYLDAMSLCKWFEYPDFFITFTCNPKWPELQRFLKDTPLHPEIDQIM
ncbi:hypothetical protein Lser_V15G37887 [Lactuca serriola]